MGLDRYQLLLIPVGIPLTLWIILAEQTGTDLSVRFSVGLAWLGIGATLYLLSRNRRSRPS